MGKYWLIAIWTFLVVSILGAGLLAYRWYDGYRIGKVIVVVATEDDDPRNKVQWQQRSDAWREFNRRTLEVQDGLKLLDHWQQTVAFTTAFNDWRSCSPPPRFGALELWKLFANYKRRDFMELMLDVPVTDRLRSDAAGTGTLENVVLEIAYENAVRMQLLGADRPINEPFHYPVVGKPLRDEITLFASSVGLSWDIIGCSVAIGTEAELAEYRWRVTMTDGRIAKLQRDSLPNSRRFAEVLRDPVTLEFVETPLSDVLDFLRDYSEQNIALLPTRLTDAEDSAKRLDDAQVTIHIHDTNLGWSLDYMLMRLRLHWDVIDETLFVGEEQEITVFVARAKSRQN